MVTLKTNTGGILTATDHAMMNWIGFPYNVILSSGVNIEVNINTLSINDDIYGILAGRLYRITNESFTFPLPTSGTWVGVLYLKLDLNNVDNPLQLLASTGASVADLVQEQNIDSGIANFDKSKVVIKWLCSFTLTTSAITGVTVLVPYGDNADYITALGNRMDTAESDITALGSRMGTAEGNISSLLTRMTTAEGDIDALNQSLENLGKWQRVTLGVGSYVTVNSAFRAAIGKMVTYSIAITTSAQIGVRQVICYGFDYPVVQYTPTVYGVAVATSNAHPFLLYGGNPSILRNLALLPADEYRISLSYLIN